ncbi:MAG: hypothetical protein LBG79_07510 [Spirochaetaceae bacterium]|jgi:hypothetical protein|nr:hypothetical protein [Spirochaetaceae bacterium]GMO29532.1 MAG: hypothetical protein Pg6A_17740 [Termitinemataceae bacterium]
MMDVYTRSRKKASGPERVAELKEKINNPDYLYGAIFRIAQVLSNDIVGIPQGGENEERQYAREERRR